MIFWFFTQIIWLLNIQIGLDDCFSFIDPLLGIGSPSLLIESFRMFSFPMNPKTRTSSINSTANFTFERLDLLMSRPQMVFQRHFGSEFTSTKFAIVSYTQMNGSHMLNVFMPVRIFGLTFGTFELLASMFGLDMNIQSTSWWVLKLWTIRTLVPKVLMLDFDVLLNRLSDFLFY